MVIYSNGQGSVILRVKLRSSASSTGAGLTGLTSGSAGLIIGTIADNEATTTRYRASSSEVETITTLGTYAAPTSGKCRFKEVDATNHPGLYEIQLADARLAVASSKSAIVSLSGATNLVETDLMIWLWATNPYDAVRGGMTALPNAAAGANGGLPLGDASARVDVGKWLGTAASTPTVAGVPNVNAKTWNDLATVALPLAPTTAGRSLDVTAANKVNGVVLVDTLTTYTGNTPQTGDSYARIGAAGISLSAIPDLAGVTTLLSRLSALRAGYLDNLSAGAVALEASLQALVTTVGVAGAGLTAADDAVIAAIAALNNLSQSNVRTAVGLASANLDTQLAAIAAFIDTEVAAIKAKTDNLPSDPADASDIAASFASIASTLSGLSTLTAAGVRSAVGLASANLDTQLSALFTTAMTESYNADGVAPTPAQALFVIMQRLTEFSISGVTITAKKLDGSTSAFTLTLDDATSPTSSTRAT